MKTELQIFQNEEFGKIRSLTINKEPWFIGKDVAEILGYSNTRKALADHVKDNHKNTVTIRDGIGNPNKSIIDEAGLYSLVMRSKLPQAEAFQEWVVSEVLPAIRKNGSYTAKQPTLIQQQRAEAMLLNARSRQSQIWLDIADKTDIAEYKHICQQKAAETLAGVPVLPMEQAGRKTYSAAEIGKMVGMTANMVGRLTKKHNLRTEQYGKMFYDKSKYSAKEVETFRYYDTVAEALKELGAC